MKPRVLGHNASHSRLWVAAVGVLLLGAAIVSSQRAYAQDEAPAPRTAAELEDLVDRIALYPDDLLAIVLPASTYPLQVVQAARFLDERANDASLEPSSEWDSSIVALLNYPEVVRMMNEDLDWTWSLGEAVLDDQAAVIGAVQIFRDRAYAAGNLRSDEKQVVTEDDGVIEIAPADPEVVYIPYYEPERVVVYQSAPAYYYYPWAYPLYYYPYPVGYAFSVGFFWGVTSAYTIGWHSHYLHVHHHTHIGHPYYHHAYYGYEPYYWRSGVNINVNVNSYSHVWQPSYYHGGARPNTYHDWRYVRAVYEGGGGRHDGPPRHDGQPRYDGSPRHGGDRESRASGAPSSYTANRGNAVVRNSPFSSYTANRGNAVVRNSPLSIAPRTATRDRGAGERATNAPPSRIGGVANGRVAGGDGNAPGRASRDGAAGSRGVPRSGNSGGAPSTTSRSGSAPRTIGSPQRMVGRVVTANPRAPAPQRTSGGAANRGGAAAQRSAPAARSAPTYRSAPPQRGGGQPRSAAPSSSRFGGVSRGGGERASRSGNSSRR
jgi:hypothetical protein